MAPSYHPDLNFELGDADFLCTAEGLPEIERGEILASLSKMILSPSGWRGIFSKDGRDEGKLAEIGLSHRYIVAAAALSFASLILKEKAIEDLHIVVATDSRPTGPAIANDILRCLLGLGLRVSYSSITAIPELMAWCRSDALGHAHCDGFIYVSASHNPIGHNGLKFGLSDGGVLEGALAHQLIDNFRRSLEDEAFLPSLRQLLARCSSSALKSVFAGVRDAKRQALSAYKLFTRRVIADSEDLKEQDNFLDNLQEAIQKSPIAVAIDFNGSARAQSIDVAFLEDLGIAVQSIHSVAGEIAHRIVPEGISLEPVAQLLESSHRKDERFILGYMSDCDGDRGNLVIYDENLGRTRALEAQEVFALALLGELSFQLWQNSPGQSAVVLNDPTSLRSDSIARPLGAQVFRAEVGEANVVNLAAAKRKEGYSIKFLGEGAAGGVITHPSAVRDPLNTLFALLKLLLIRRSERGPGLFELWCIKSGQADSYREDFTLGDILLSLPKFSTTAAYEDRALLHIGSSSQENLKRKFEAIFIRQWKEKKAYWEKKAQLASWQASAYNGIEERVLQNNFAESGKGGLRILFKDSQGRERAFIWMRASGTEPVFRIMAEYGWPEVTEDASEVKNSEIEAELLAWLRAMIEEADTNGQDPIGVEDGNGN